MGPYIYVLIAALGIFPLLIVYKITMERIKSGEGSIEQAQMKFFLWVAIVEILPIILLVFAMSSTETVASFDEVMVPGLLVLVFMGVGSLFTLLQGVTDTPADVKGRVKIFSLIGMSFVNAMPIISIVGLITMIA